MNENSQKIIVLFGIPGCGKSTFAKNFIKSLPSDKKNEWVSLNQDVYKSRSRVKQRAEIYIQQRKNIIIDRCNFDCEQRRPWIELGMKYGITDIYCVIMPQYRNVNLCSARAFDRGDDGLHDGDTDWDHVCQSIQSQIEMPDVSEGFSNVIFCQSYNETIQRLTQSL